MGLCLLVLLAHGAVAAAGLPPWSAPPFVPPGEVYAPLWAMLYPLTGVAAWLVWRRIDAAAERKRAALRLWGWQVLFSALWPAAFFGAHDLSLALAAAVAVLASILLTARAFSQVSVAAVLLLLPYGAWLVCIAYVNAGFWFLNAL